jgi:hypothetical protein
VVVLQQGADLGVLKQSPKAGRELKRGAKITIDMQPHATIPRAIILWCSPNPGNSAAYSTNCSNLQQPSLGNPGDPVRTRVGHELYFDAYVMGSRPDDNNPNGYLTFALSGAAHDYRTSSLDALGNLDPGCGHVYNYQADDAGGVCTVIFNEPGTYVLAVAFTDTDRQYGRIPLGPFVTIIVTGQGLAYTPGS